MYSKMDVFFWSTYILDDMGRSPGFELEEHNVSDCHCGVEIQDSGFT